MSNADKSREGAQRPTLNAQRPRSTPKSASMHHKRLMIMAVMGDS